MSLYISDEPTVEHLQKPSVSKEEDADRESSASGESLRLQHIEEKQQLLQSNYEHLNDLVLVLTKDLEYLIFELGKSNLSVEKVESLEPVQECDEYVKGENEVPEELQETQEQETPDSPEQESMEAPEQEAPEQEAPEQEAPEQEAPEQEPPESPEKELQDTPLTPEQEPLELSILIEYPEPEPSAEPESESSTPEPQSRSEPIDYFDECKPIKDSDVIQLLQSLDSLEDLENPKGFERKIIHNFNPTLKLKLLRSKTASKKIPYKPSNDSTPRE